ncbi:MAG: type II secretion system protein GspN [Myxococcota bacterium]
MNSIKPWPPGRKKALAWTGYISFFISIFLLFFYWTFPWNRIRDYLVQEFERSANQRADGRGRHLEIDSLRPYWLSGVQLEGVRVIEPSEIDADSTYELAIDSVVAQISLFRLLIGTQKLDFKLELAGGTFEGSLTKSGRHISASVDIEDLNLRQVGIIENYVGLPVGGRLTGALTLEVPEVTAEATGSAEFAIKDASIEGGKLKIAAVPMLRNGLTVERLSLGELALNMNVSEGKATIEELKADGEDARIAGSGTVRLLSPLKRSRLDILLRLEFLEAYRKRNEVTERLFLVLDNVPQLRPARTRDEALQFRLGGSVAGGVRMVPAGGALAPGSSG